MIYRLCDPFLYIFVQGIIQFLLAKVTLFAYKCPVVLTSFGEKGYSFSVTLAL
jgi:hypothetical protein